MAYQHLDILNGGVEAWDKWRKEHPHVTPSLIGENLSSANLRGANLSGANLSGANFRDAYLENADLSSADLSYAKLSGAKLNRTTLSGAELRGVKLNRTTLQRIDLRGADLSGAFFEGAGLENADLRGTNLSSANLSSANLSRANLSRANFRDANLSYAKLNEANLRGANLRGANLRGANLSNASLERSVLVKTNFSKAILNGCSIFGVSAWEVELEGAQQKNLKITESGKPVVTVDNLEVAQFIYLLLNNQKIRQVIDTITSKAVLILGRFTLERKVVLDAIREELRKRDYLPILFDFDKPASRDVHETVKTLAGLAHFIIADITDPRSIPQELVSIVPAFPSVPVQPLLQKGSEPWGMFEYIARFPWVLGIHYYDNSDNLVTSLDKDVIGPAAAKAEELKPQSQ